LWVHFVDGEPGPVRRVIVDVCQKVLGFLDRVDGVFAEDFSGMDVTNGDCAIFVDFAGAGGH